LVSQVSILVYWKYHFNFLILY